MELTNRVRSVGTRNTIMAMVITGITSTQGVRLNCPARALAIAGESGVSALPLMNPTARKHVRATSMAGAEVSMR